MPYQSQRVAYAYFLAALLLFGLQVAFGFMSLAKYLGPDPLLNIMNFATSKAIHTNLLLVWVLTGFMGATYYMVPEESQTEIYSVRLAYIQLALWLAIGVAAVVGYLFGVTAGRKLLEMPQALKYGVVVVMLIFLLNILLTIRQAGRWTTTQGVLIGGLASAALLFIAGMIPFDNYTLDRFYRWWVVHLWVGGCVGADPRRHSGLSAHPSLGGGPRGHGKVAVRHRGADLSLGHPRHRAPLLLDRRAALLAVGRWHLFRTGAAGLSGHGSLRL